MVASESAPKRALFHAENGMEEGSTWQRRFTLRRWDMLYVQRFFAMAGSQRKNEGKMQVEIRSIREIKPYEHNPRSNDCAVDAVAASIKEFGWQQPIVVDKDGVIIAGHTRFKAAKKLGLKEVPVVVAENLTDEQVKAYRLADNKTGELAGWDFSALEEELVGLAEIDMQQFGFAGSETEDFNIDNLFAEAAPKEKEAKEIKCPHCGMYFTP